MSTASILPSGGNGPAEQEEGRCSGGDTHHSASGSVLRNERHVCVKTGVRSNRIAASDPTFSCSTLSNVLTVISYLVGRTWEGQEASSPLRWEVTYRTPALCSLHPDSSCWEHLGTLECVCVCGGVYGSGHMNTSAGGDIRHTLNASFKLWVLPFSGRFM